jgi:immune inhibitor A
MARIGIAVLLFSIASTAVSSSQAMPLRPDVAERMQAEGKLAEERAFMESAYARGVNNPPAWQATGILRSGSSGNQILTSTGRAIVLLVDFNDNLADTANYPTSHYDDLLFSVGTYPSGSMRDYYIENSYGTFEVVGENSGWHRMPQTYAYYVDGQRGFGTYPRNAQKLTEDAVLEADPYVDFSQYDNDGPDGIPDSGDDDGYVDALFVVHAGPGYETTGNVNQIHSHAWVTNGPVSVDGVLVYRYSMEPEDGKIGVFCHEFGHVLGLPDLYDYGYDSRGAGYWSLMAGGSWGGGGTTPVHFDGWSKTELGFVTPIVPATNLIDVAILNVEQNPEIYQVMTDGIIDKQYFVVEHRRKIGFDTSCRGQGLVIYHVDTKQTNNDNQMCGAGHPHYLVAVEQADGECDLEYDRNSGDAGDPWPGLNGTGNPNRAFNLLSTPNTNKYNDDSTGVAVYNIRIEGDVAYASFAVSAVAPYAEVIFPNGGEVFEGGTQDTIRWLAFDDLAVDSVSVLLSTDGGSTFPHLIAGGEPNDSMLVWDITGYNSTNCRIKVVAYDNEGNATEDMSDGDFMISDVAGVVDTGVTDFNIISVKPNPASAGTRVVFASPHTSAKVRVYDVAGRLLSDLPVSTAAASPNLLEAYWDGKAGGRAVAPGVYFVRVTDGNKARTARVTIAR